MTFTECDVTAAAPNADREPWPVVIPYETCDVRGCSVVQRIVAEFIVMSLAVTSDSTVDWVPPAVGSALARTPMVVKSASGDVVTCPAELVESAAE